MTTKPKRPWRMLAPLTIVLALFGLWSGYWFFAQAAAKSYAETYREKLANKGVSLKCNKEGWGGYPFRFEFTCSEPVLQLPGGRMANSTNLLILAQAYNPSHLIALVDGPSRVQLSPGKTIDFTHDRAAGSVILGGDGFRRLSVDISNLNATNLFSMKYVQLHTRSGKNNGYDIAINIEAAQLIDPGRPPIDIDQAQLLATLETPEKIQVQSVNLQRGTIELSGSGPLSIDPEHRLSGQIAAQTNNLSGLMSLADPHIDLTDQERTSLKAVLGLLGNDAKINLTAQNGEFSIGPVKIGELPPLY
jgi:hypothetical protein